MYLSIFYFLILLFDCKFLWDSISLLSTLILIFHILRGGSFKFVFLHLWLSYVSLRPAPLTLFMCFDLLTRFTVAVSTDFFHYGLFFFVYIYFCCLPVAYAICVVCFWWFLLCFFKRTFRLSQYVGLSHARTVVRECCKGDDESQWERGKFDPPPPKNPLTDGHQNLSK